jgi:hypothetical protein
MQNSEKNDLVQLSARAGWHGMHVAQLGVDWQLVAELTPEGRASKVFVDARSPALKAGLKDGDYVISASCSMAADLSLHDLDRRALPPGTELLVNFYRPGWRRGELRTAVVRLRKPPGPAKPPAWHSIQRVPLGRAVLPRDRKRFLAGISKHPGMTPYGCAILQRMLLHYDGPRGIFPAVSTLGKDVGLKERATQYQLDRLEWLGVLERVEYGGRATKQGGRTNRYIVHWPEGWGEDKTVHAGAPHGCTAATLKGAPACTQTLLPLTHTSNPSVASRPSVDNSPRDEVDAAQLVATSADAQWLFDAGLAIVSDRKWVSYPVAEKRIRCWLQDGGDDAAIVRRAIEAVAQGNSSGDRFESLVRVRITDLLRSDQPSLAFPPVPISGAARAPAAEPAPATAPARHDRRLPVVVLVENTKC